MIVLSKHRERLFNQIFTTLLIALIYVLGYTPIGFFQLGVISITTLHIPVIIAILFMDWRYATITGTAFGVISLINAYIRGSGLDVVFLDPRVSVLPRFLFAILSAMLFKAIKPKFYRSERWIYLTDIVVSFLFSLIHSILTLSAIVIFPPVDVPSERLNTLKLALSILGTHSMVEALLTAFIAPPIVKALRTLKNRL